MDSYHKYIFLVPLIALLSIAQNKYTEPDYYRAGLAALKEKSMDEAAKCFEKSIYEYNDALSYYELAKIYLERGSFVQRAKALRLLKKGVYRDPESLEIRMAYAKLLEDFSKFSAIDQYEYIITRDSTNSTARLRLATIREKDFDEYYKSYRDMEGVLLAPLSEYALEDFREAEFQYLKALEFDPENKDLLLALSRLYQRSDSLDAAIKYLHQLSKVDPASNEAHLYLGLCYNLTQEYEKAHKEFGKAIALMTFEEKNDFTLNSVIELIEPVFEGIDEINNPQYVNNVINAYWQMSDPLFKKGINERLLEHYTRVAYANLHYSVPDMGIEGWKTDRGKTVLRYGIPRERKRLRPSKTEWGVSMKTEIWNYDDMFFAFTDQFSSGNYAYSAPTGEKSRFKSQYGGDSHTYAQNLLNIRHQDYRPPFYGEKLDLEYDIPQFRNIKNGKITDMVFTYSYEAHDSTVSRYDSLQNHLWSLEIFDNYFTNVFSAEQTANPDDVKVRKIDEYNLYQSTTLVSLAPDSGYLSFKIFRSNDKGFSTIIQPMRISEFSSDKLLVSDIIFASELSNNKFEYSLTRGDISLNPVSSQLLEKDGNLYIYYEIYNLSKNAGHLTDFKIDLNIHEAEGDGVFEGIGSLVNDALSILGGGSETSFNFSSQYQTVEQNPQMYLQLDLSELAADDYVLEIEIVDNNTGEINRSKIDFRLF